MTAFAQVRADTGRDVRWYLTIEGVGYGLSSGALASAISDGTGLVRFWSSLPEYVTDALLAAQPEMRLIHREVLVDLPDVLSERVESLGGVAELGDISFAVVDEVDQAVGGTYSKPAGFLTHLMQLVSDPVATLTAPSNTSDTSLDVSDDGGIITTTPDNVVFVGAEAMRVTNAAANVVTVDRAHLGTAAQSHSTGDAVRVANPFVHRRICNLYCTPNRASSISDDVLIGQYVIEDVRFDGRMCAWKFRAKSISAFLDRSAPIASDAVVVESAAPTYLAVSQATLSPLQSWRVWTGSQADALEHFYAECNGEVFSARQPNITFTIQPIRRGVCGTPKSEIQPGNVVRRVLVAEYDRAGDFRYSASQSTSPTDADWTKTAHWVDLMLCILTSSADLDDGLYFDNFTGSHPNYACLPIGYGLGLPASRIDWEGWLEVKARTPDYLFPWFVYGGQRESFRDLVTREFLRPIGARLFSSGSLIKLSLPRAPWSGATSVTIDESDILGRETSKLIEPEVETYLAGARLAGTTQYRLGPEQVVRTYNDAEFAGTLGGRGYYAHEDKVVVIEVPGADPSRATWVDAAALSKLHRARRPRLGMSAAVDLDAGYQADVGSVVSVTLPGAVDLAGARGWTEQLLEVDERELEIDRAAYTVRAEGFGFGSQIRKICPSAYVASVSSNTATVVENRYTQADAPDGLPATDAAAFTAGDKVRLKDTSGASLSGTTQEVVSVSGNDIELDGNFGGSLAGNTVITYALAADASTDQTDGWAFEVVPNSTPLSRYGER